MASMRAIVTGGAGFIGSHLVDALGARDAEILVVDNLATGRRERLDGTPFEKLDVRDADGLAAAFARVRPTHVFHLAAQADVRVSVRDPAFDATVNVVGTINVVTAALAHDAQVVFASTGGAIYGEKERRPTPEDEPVEPEAPYGTAKYCAEEYLRLFNRLHGTRHVALRLGNVFGPRQDPAGEAGVVSIFSGRVVRDEPLTIFGDGTQTRDYVWVGDVVQAFLAAAAAGRGGTWNVGTGIETSVLDLVEGLAKATGKRIEPQFAPARAGELQASALDASALARDLGVSAQVAVGDGLPRVYAWVAAGEPARGALA
jgi:UDP-glucose 4-epimerase